jgi:MoaA/NifB/PqqE/SkfB family radical SAM enzyme
MSTLKNNIALIKAILANPQMIRVDPAINWFMTRYMNKFSLVDVDGQLVLHSHLPAINSPAFTRFIDEHLLAKSTGPTHAQISLTSACPQNCSYCYNKNRSGHNMDTETIKRVITDLKQMGVVWLGLTGGEPLLNKDIVEIVRSIGNGCAIKLFTTGTNISEQLAFDLRNAGLFYVSVSLDHWQEEEHDRARGCQGAYKTALRAVDIFRKTKGIHTSVSAVISKEMLQKDQVEKFIQFLINLDIHEVWLSETKPSGDAFWNQDAVITEAEHKRLIELQDKYNKSGEVTINYLGHFESKDYFGCNAGHKMVYVDAFGEVSPCVFTPITFGNVRDKSVQTIFSEMKKRFPSENCCFINKNYGLLQKHYHGKMPLSQEDTQTLMSEVRFAPPAKFFHLYYKRDKSNPSL